MGILKKLAFGNFGEKIVNNITESWLIDSKIKKLKDKVQILRCLLRVDGDHLHFAAGEVAFLDHLDLNGNLSLQLFHVADDAHVATRLGMERTQRVDGILQGLAAEGAKALIDEEGVDRQLLSDIAECKGQ